MALENAATPYLIALAENSDQIVFAYDTISQKFNYLNPAFEQVWGKSRKSVLARPAALLKTIHPEDRPYVRQVYQALLEKTSFPTVEFRIVLRDETIRWVCLRPQLLAASGVLVGYGEDITAQKHYEDYLKKFSDKKNSILNILSHDLAGPLGFIYNLSTMLQQDVQATGNEDLGQMISLIEKSSRQGMQLIQEFIKQEFLESTAVEVIRRRVDLVQILREIITEYQSTQSLTAKTFYFEPASDKIFVSLDSAKFTQVINNLISNAIKFTPDGGEITLRLEEKENLVLIQVSDNGIGIPEKYHATLFDKFTRARRPGLKGEPSVGLGMSIIKTIVEWHQGKVWFASQQNQGTTFYIELPKNC